MGMKQLFDDESSTYTYLLWDINTKDAIIVDPVDIQVDRDLKEVQAQLQALNDRRAELGDATVGLSAEEETSRSWEMYQIRQARRLWSVRLWELEADKEDGE